MAAGSAFEGLRRSWDNLNERERRLVSLLGAVFGALIVFLVVYGSTAAIEDAEEESDQIESVLNDIARAKGRLRAREAERRSAAQRYETPAPPLGSFLESQARTAGLTVREVNDQPEKVNGGFRRRNVRATIPGVGLRPTVDLMANIVQSPYPVAIERIQIEHFQAGDRYNVQLGVLAYDRQSRAGARAAVGQRPAGAAGPPSPP